MFEDTGLYSVVAPRAPVEQASTARGARNFVPRKSKRGPSCVPLGKASLGKTRPSFCGKLACSQRGETFGAVIGLLRQNAKSGRPPSIHHHKPTSLLAMSGAAHPPSAQAHCARSSPRELADALSRRAKDMQQQRPRACCLAPSLRQC